MSTGSPQSGRTRSEGEANRPWLAGQKLVKSVPSLGCCYSAAARRPAGRYRARANRVESESPWASGLSQDDVGSAEYPHFFARDFSEASGLHDRRMVGPADHDHLRLPLGRD